MPFLLFAHLLLLCSLVTVHLQASACKGPAWWYDAIVYGPSLL